MPFYLVNLASGNGVTVEATSETAAAALALQNHGADDPREEVIEVVCMGDAPSDYQH